MSKRQKIEQIVVESFFHLPPDPEELAYEVERRLGGDWYDNPNSAEWRIIRSLCKGAKR